MGSGAHAQHLTNPAWRRRCSFHAALGDTFLSLKNNFGTVARMDVSLSNGQMSDVAASGQLLKRTGLFPPGPGPRLKSATPREIQPLVNIVIFFFTLNIFYI